MGLSTGKKAEPSLPATNWLPCFIEQSELDRGNSFMGPESVCELNVGTQFKPRSADPEKANILKSFIEVGQRREAVVWSAWKLDRGRKV
ncbi:hypothetical protein PoB_001804200 [Plakobranchus ocellatus]|uniref:Uncharacterized protein n=1 Tax=Plakobranchus ocellatus TaxID=259542 RepID=A0AAV3ZAI0_9GAST|nr:hypothetical protein PoB_001804200 [Plakobranchus ocellatus]